MDELSHKSKAKNIFDFNKYNLFSLVNQGRDYWNSFIYLFFFYTFPESYARHLKSPQFFKSLALFVGYRLFLG